MKTKLKFVIMFLFLSTVSYGQLVRNRRTGQVENLPKICEMYCIVQSRNLYKPKNMMSTKVIHEWELDLVVNNDDVYEFIDSTEHKIEFQTIVSASNYMHKYGWELMPPISNQTGTSCWFKKGDALKEQ